jgi:hypothetical protein
MGSDQKAGVTATKIKCQAFVMSIKFLIISFYNSEPELIFAPPHLV